MNFSATTRVMLVTTLLFLLAAGLGCATGSGAAASREPTEAWNQQKVTELAGQLTTSAHTLYTTLYEDPEHMAMGMGSADNSMAGSVRELGESAAGLHAKLESGKGRTATLGEYERIKELSRDVTEASGFTDTPTDATSAKGAMTSLLSQLDGYYGAY